jgi:hypothetical protein
VGLRQVHVATGSRSVSRSQDHKKKVERDGRLAESVRDQCCPSWNTVAEGVTSSGQLLGQPVRLK